MYSLFAKYPFTDFHFLSSDPAITGSLYRQSVLVRINHLVWVGCEWTDILSVPGSCIFVRFFLHFWKQDFEL